MIDLKNCRAFAIGDSSPEQRIEILERIVLDLMVEIEALRSSVIELCASQPAAAGESILDRVAAGVPGPHTIYGNAYLEAGWLSHWSAGPTSGSDKIVELFYPGEYGAREAQMLRRLGYNEEQIRCYLESVRGAMLCT